MGLGVGAAKELIALPEAVHLSGYVGRLQPSTGVLDPVYVRSLVLESGGRRMILVTADVLGFAVADARRIRRLLADEHGVEEALVLLAATHTHAGPATQFLRRCGTVDPGFFESLAGTILAAVRKAAGRMRPARVRMGQGSAHVSANRRAADGPVDPAVSAFYFEALDGAPIAAVCHYACHPVVFGPQNRLVSAEYPGRAAAALERGMGGDSVGLFVNGAAGDINPAIWGSMAKTPPTWEDASLGVQVIEQMGQTLADEALAVSRNAEPLDVLALSGAVTTLILPFAPLEPLSEVEKSIEAIKAASPSGEGVLPPEVMNDDFTREVNAAMLGYFEERRNDLTRGIEYAGVRVDVAVIRLGDWLLPAIPGELFAGAGMAMKEALAPSPVAVCGYSNGNVGYLPTADQYAQPGYEVGLAHRYYGYPAPVAPEAEKLLLEAVTAMAANLRRDAI